MLRHPPGGLMNNNRSIAAAYLALSLTTASAASAEGLRPDQAAFREIYRELVETNTTLSAGNCTEAAQKMAAHLRAAGYPESDLHMFTTPDHPKEGGLVAILPGTDPKARPMLLLAHIDVVEARREDWERDPFKLIEEGGYFYARGALDDKSMSATWVDTLIRLRGERTKPRRTVKMALTCGEETNGAFNGAEYLVKEKRDLIDAAFALNEGAWGMLDASGIRWRIVVISACYAGGFIAALSDPHTVVMAAAAPDRTSFGCSTDSEMTFFTEALFKQALPI